MDQYAVFGYPVAHSKSPLIHGAFAQQTGEPLEYRAIEAQPGFFPREVRRFCDGGGLGFNVTLPFKEDAWRLADRCDSAASRARSVNTMRVEADGRLSGFNTDGAGLVRDLRRNHRIALRGRDILILGAGGSAAGILGPLADARPARIVVANRTEERAVRLVRDMQLPQWVLGCGLDALDPVHGNGFDLIINATSASLQGQMPALPDAILRAGGTVYDLMYGAKSVPFVTWGRERGARLALDGLGMLVEQAAEAFLIWRGVRPDTGPVIRLLRAGA